MPTAMLPLLLLAASHHHAQPATHVTYQARLVGLPASGDITQITVSHAFADGTVAGMTRHTVGGRNRATAWIAQSGSFTELVPPFESDQARVVTLEGAAPGGRAVATFANMAFRWHDGKGTRIPSIIPPGRAAEAKGFFSADMLPSGLIFSTWMPVDGGGPSCCFYKDDKPVWVGLTGEGFQLGKDGPTMSCVIADKPDGTIIGESQTFRPGDQSGLHKEAGGSWVGSTGWLYKNGVTTPLKPVTKDSSGNPLCRPERVLPDGTLLVKIPNSYGLAETDTVKPLNFKGLTSKSELGLILHSPSGKHLVFESFIRNSPRTLAHWYVESLRPYPRELKPPSVRDTAGEIVNIRPLLIEDSTRIILSARRAASTAADPSELLWTHLPGGKPAVFVPDGTHPNDYRGTVDPRAHASKFITGQRIEKPHLAGLSKARSQAWIFIASDNRFIMPDFGAIKNIDDWESRILAMSPDMTAFMECTDHTVNPPRRGFYAWNPASGFAEITISVLGGNGNPEPPRVLEIDHVLGDDGRTLIVKMTGQGSRIKQGTNTPGKPPVNTPSDTPEPHDLFMLTRR